MSSTGLRALIDARRIAVPADTDDDPLLAMVARNLRRGRIDIIDQPESEDDAVLWPRDGAPPTTGIPIAVDHDGDGTEELRLDRERGGFCVRTEDDRWLNLLPFEWGPKAGPVAILSSSAPVAHAIVAALAEFGRGASVIGCLDPEHGAGLDVWLDIAARHPDIAAVGVFAPSFGDPAALAEVARAVSLHVPIVRLDPRRKPERREPWMGPWVASLGMLRASTVRDTAAALSVLVDLDPPAGLRAAVVSPSRGAATLLAQELSNVRIDVDIHDAGDDLAAGVARALGNTGHDLVVAAVPDNGDSSADATLRAIGTARREHTELPLIVTTTGDRSWHRRVSRALQPQRIPVLRAGDSIDVAIASLFDWHAKRARLESASTYRVADPHRVRRVAHSLRSGRSGAHDPGVQAELLAGLAISSAPFRRASYIEDALVVGAEIGYPLEVAAVHPALGFERPPLSRIVHNSDELQYAAEVLLAEARRIGGAAAELVLRQELPATIRVEVSVERKGAFGPIVTLTEDGGWTTYVAPPLGEPDLAAIVARYRLPASERPVVAAALYQVAGAILGAMQLVPELDAVAIRPLSISAGGVVAREVAVRIAIDPENT